MFKVDTVGQDNYRIAKKDVLVEWTRENGEFLSRVVHSSMWVLLETFDGVYTLRYYSYRELIGLRRYAGHGYREDVLASVSEMRGWEEYSPILEMGRGPITELYGKFGQFLCESAYKLGY